MNNNNSLRSWCFAAVALVGGCIDAPKPDPDPAIPTTTVSGIVEIEAPIEGATVYVDFNDNNKHDAGEPSATTDAAGHFTLSWDDVGFFHPHTVGAIVAATSPRAELHMRAPLVDASGVYADSVVVSPLTTLVVSEMASDATMTLDRAERKIAGALGASKLPLSGQRLDVMSDYTRDYMTSTDSAQLRLVASAVATLVSNAAAKINSSQTYIDVNDVQYFTPAIVAMDTQLTRIADGTSKFLQLSAAEQADIVQNPQNHVGFFVDTTALADEIEKALLDALEELAAYAFDYIKDKFAEELANVATELVAEGLMEAII